VPADSIDVSERAQKQEQSARADNSSCKKMRIAVVQMLLYYHFFFFAIAAPRPALLQKPFPDRERVNPMNAPDSVNTCCRDWQKASLPRFD
jgi:hypothetical protein